MTDMQPKPRTDDKILQEVMGDDPSFIEARQRYEQANKINEQRREQFSTAMRAIARTKHGKILVRELERIVVAQSYDENVNKMYMLEGGRNTARYLLSLTRKEA